jgi:hypothetical protein
LGEPKFLLFSDKKNVTGTCVNGFLRLRKILIQNLPSIDTADVAIIMKKVCGTGTILVSLEEFVQLEAIG